jgi:hypothetical protein
MTRALARADIGAIMRAMTRALARAPSRRVDEMSI